MKKLILTFCLFFSLSMAGRAQKIATVDMNYILKNIPAYEAANEQLNQISKKWQAEVEAQLKEVETMYKNYQTELVFMTEEMKKKREDEIIAKEKAAQELKRTYFGPEGELFKKRQSLMKPIQDEIFTAVQEISKEKNIDLVLDKSTSVNIIFSSPALDISDEILKQLGYSK
ncbi:MAG TPA: OmpH family outer membrane protein [Paludibacteraceae bacterium]|jgi:outer membrane protein|nr:OmpH family outer membrane protein [Paludibacteraceae bacterium]